jgi:hypothetical protein
MVTPSQNAAISIDVNYDKVLLADQTVLRQATSEVDTNPTWRSA